MSADQNGLVGRKNDFVDFFLLHILPLVLIFILGVFLYAQIFHAPAQIDDHDLLFGNPFIKDIGGFGRYGYLHYSQKVLTLLTFAVNYFFSKEDTFGYHVVNVVLHGITATFLYYFLLALRSAPESSQSSFLKERNWFALFSALIFFVHPLHTESVSYLWQRSEVLSGLFYMAALWSYLEGRIRGKIFYYGLTVFLYGIGFFAKGTIITLPLLIALLEAAFFQYERIEEKFKKCWPYMAMGGIGLFVVLQIPVITRMIYNFFLSFSSEVRSEYVFTQFLVLWKYVGLSFLPVHQNIDHDVPLSPGLSDPMTLASLGGLLVLGILTVVLFKRYRLMAVGIVWFFIYLLPTSFVLRDPMWEHRLYFSLAGFAIFLTAAIFTVVTNAKIRTVLAVAIILVFSGLTVMRNSLWRSPVLLLEDTVKKSPLKARPHHMLGTAYMNENQTEKAFKQFQIAIYLDPSYAEPYNSLGVILLQNGQFFNATNYFERAIALEKTLETPYINLAYLILYTRGDLLRAEDLFKKSLGYRETLEGYVGLGNLYLEKKDYENARTAFQRALKLSYNNPVVFYGLGNAYYYQNDYQKALAMYNKTIDLDSSFADCYYNIGMIYYQTKEFDLSRQWMEKAFRQRPRRLDICQSLVRVNEDLGATAAAEEYRQGCQRLSYELSMERKK